MQVVIVSDTHKRNERLAVLEKAYDGALFIHAGDFQEDPEQFDHWISVLGNNDSRFEGQAPWIRILDLEGHHVLLLHGHQAVSNVRMKKLAAMAKENECDTVILGHSHIPMIEKYEGILFLNPGSLARNRKGGGATYIVADFTHDEISAKIVPWIPV